VLFRSQQLVVSLQEEYEKVFLKQQQSNEKTAQLIDILIEKVAKPIHLLSSPLNKLIPPGPTKRTDPRYPKTSPRPTKRPLCPNL